MGIRGLLSKALAAWVGMQDARWIKHPVGRQRALMKNLVKQAKDTKFGKDHDFANIKSYQDFKARVPIRDYEGLAPYIELIKQGQSDVLWPGKPAYFAKTSGTTSGTKYIPLTKASLPNHMNSARNAVLNYIRETGNSDFMDGWIIFVSGSPVLEKTAGIPTGRLSGIVNHHVPAFLRTNQMPTYETNCIEDWEEKLEAVIDETLQKDMTLISGIPPWVQMYFDRIEARTGKKIKDVFPRFSVFVYGGVNFEPYRAKLFESIGKPVDSIETYPASEGFIAYQDRQNDPGLLLLADSGIFFEFIPADKYYDEKPERICIVDVEIGKNYAIIINSKAGLWGYSLGDTVKFVSLHPHRIVVSGRLKHFISAFGEHVIGEEVENAMRMTLSEFPAVDINEFTVAPLVSKEAGKSRHQWLIAFSRPPADLERFAQVLDSNLTKLNTYYDDLIKGNILSQLEVIPLKSVAFHIYMRSKGKLGGQNKVPRLSNDRSIADELIQYQA